MVNFYYTAAGSYIETQKSLAASVKGMKSAGRDLKSLISAP
jgi:hypothetical protein